MKKVFILYCDEVYYKFYGTILKSIEVFEPEATTILHLINSTITGPNIVNQSIEYDSPDKKAAHIICHKIKYMLETMANIEGDLYVQLDIDMLLNRSLQIDGTYDIGGFVISPNKVAGGILMAQKTDMAYKFLNEYNERLINGFHYWDKDQPLLARLYNEYIPKGLVWKQVGRDYLDYANSAESFIWSAHKSEFGNKDKRLAGFKRRVERI